MQALGYIVFAFIGLVTGGLLNICIDHLPLSGSSSQPGDSESRRRTLNIKDLLLSLSSVRLPCSLSGKSVTHQRVLWVQAGAGAVFVFLFWRYGLTPQFGILALYSSIFIILLVIDLEHQMLPNKVVYPAMTAALMASFFLPEPGFTRALLGGIAGFGLFFVIALVARGGMGWGDVKLAGLVGLVTGLPQVFVALLTAILLGGVTAITLLALRIKHRKQVIPFGPFLAIGAMATLLYGKEIIDWYLTWLARVN